MILKLQQGGSAIPPLVSYQPVMLTGQAGTAASTAGSSDDSGSDLTDKDLITMLDKLDGLPNDMKAITNALQNFYIDQKYSVLPDTTSIASRYLSILQSMKTANFNKKQYDQAFDIVKSNGGINEFAITERGQLVCINADKDFKLLSPEDLKQNEGYKPLTNSELLQLRAYNPELTNDASLLGVVNNGIGIKTVTDYVNSVISRLGTDTNIREGFASTSQRDVLSGLEAFQKAVAQSGSYDSTVNNLYKGKLLTASQAAQAEQALKYIYQSLPENARTLLKTKSSTLDDKGAIDILGSLITSTLDSRSEFTMSLDTPDTKNAGSDGSTKKTLSSAVKLDPVSLLQAGYGQKQNITIMTGAGKNVGIQVPTVRMPIVDASKHPMGVGTLADVAESGFSGYLDFSNATMGGVVIPTEGFNSIAVDGTALYTAYLPVDAIKYNQEGIMRPDIAMLGRYKEAQKLIQENNITDPAQINQIYRDKQLPIMYSSNGEVLNNYIKFGIINGTALSTAFKQDVEFEDYLEETFDENIISNTLNALQKGRGEKDRLKFDQKGFWNRILGGGDSVYRGTIFIPLVEDYFTSSIGFGDYPTAGQAEMIESRQQAAGREALANRNYNDPNAQK